MTSTYPTVTDLLDHPTYHRLRAERRAAMIPVRQQRRVTLGDLVGLEFENADTLAYQVQEMVFTERLTQPEDIGHELAAYARMLPTSHELCATLFLYLTDPATVRARLSELQGLHRALALRVGNDHLPGVPLVPLDAPDDDETVTVHVVRFTFTDAQRTAFLDPAVPVAVVVDHPAYSESVELSGPTRERLAADLDSAGDSPV